MPYLIVAGITLNVENTKGSGLAPITTGGRSRSFNNTLRSTVRSEKGQWQFELSPMLLSAYNTLKAAIALDAHVTCSGDALGASMTCVVTINGFTDERAANTEGFVRTVSLNVQQV